jgi:hypothetical protein
VAVVPAGLLPGLRLRHVRVRPAVRLEECGAGSAGDPYGECVCPPAVDAALAAAARGLALFPLPPEGRVPAPGWQRQCATDPDRIRAMEWSKIAHQYVTEMGFAGDGERAGCRWIAVHHGRSVAGNDHIHLVITRATEDGAPVYLRGE